MVEVEQAISFLQSGNYTLYLYNNCHGGGPPKLNNAANFRYEQLVKASKDFEDTQGHRDAMLMKVVFEFWEQNRLLNSCHLSPPDHPSGSGRHPSGPYSQHGFFIVPTQFIEFVKKDEYDGLESPYVDVEGCIRSRLEEKLEEKGVITKAEYEAI